MTENQLPTLPKGGTSAGRTLVIAGDNRVAVTVFMGVLTIVVFVLDCLTPLGYAIWLLISSR
jgi:hypothetical protein